MQTLIVTSHPSLTSLTRNVANHIADGITSADSAHRVEIADLHQENFAPAYQDVDYQAFNGQRTVPDDVRREQQRIDAADNLVLVFPIYWWSMPGMMKGWIDRVFTNGWAYEESPDGKLLKKLGRLNVWLVGLGAATEDVYQRHNYFEAMKTQLEHGIFGYCGAQFRAAEWMLPSQLPRPEDYLTAARELGQRIGSGAR